jgi:hypothetical protein
MRRRAKMKCRGGRQMARSAVMFAGFVAVSLTVPGAIAAATPSTGPRRISQGHAGSLPWTLTVSTRNINAGTTHVPGLCVTFLWAWGPGQAIGNGFPTCIAPAIGKATPQGTQWTFDLDVAGYHGVAPFGYGGTGIRGLVVVAVPEARRVQATLTDGEVLRLQAHPLPAQLRRPAAIAWAVTHNPHQRSVKFRSVVAYDAHGRVVGHYK